jgi:hypothetical protein
MRDITASFSDTLQILGRIRMEGDMRYRQTW